MAEQSGSATSWWQTLPGILTGIAAVITALGGAYAVLRQGGSKPVEAPASQSAAAAGAASAAVPIRSAAQRTAVPGMQIGHWQVKLLGTQASPWPQGEGKSPKVALRLALRVTDLAGTSDYIDRQTVRLAVDGAQLLPENDVNQAVYDRQAVELEAMYVVPADAASIELLFGRSDSGVGKLPLAPTVLR